MIENLRLEIREIYKDKIVTIKKRMNFIKKQYLLSDLCRR